MEEARRYAQIGETAYMKEKWLLATSFMESHPGLELRLTGRKFVSFWIGTDSPVKNFRETDSYLIRVILVVSFLTAAGGVFGIIALWRKRPEMVLPLTVFPVIFPCLYYVTHADLRYRHPIDPVVLLLTAIGVATASELAKKKLKRGSIEDAARKADSSLRSE
jgi:hypothetical protein